MRRIGAQPFGLPHWGMSFPLAALAALTLRLAEQPDGLSLATLRGLRAGALLVPESAPVVPLHAKL